jgi:hypothetical protein
MKLHITVDIFSGRPNPTWTLTHPEEVADLIRAFAARPTALTDPAAGGYEGLGFRGIEVEVENGPNVASLPRRFRVASGGSPDEAAGAELAQRLLATMPDRLTGTSPPIGPGVPVDPTVLRQVVSDELARRTAAGE